mgnify:CR=1 FL=1
MSSQGPRNQNVDVSPQLPATLGARQRDLADPVQDDPLGSGQPLVGPSYLLPAYAGAFLGATTVTPGGWYLARMLEALDPSPVNVALLGKGNTVSVEGLREQLAAGASGFKLHEDWGTTPAAIDACLRVCDEQGVQAAIHTDTLDTVLHTVTRVVAPLLPYVAEDVYRGLTGELTCRPTGECSRESAVIWQLVQGELERAWP